MSWLTSELETCANERGWTIANSIYQGIVIEYLKIVPHNPNLEALGSRQKIKMWGESGFAEKLPDQSDCGSKMAIY